MEGECGGSLSPCFSPMRDIQTPCREGFVKGGVAQLFREGAVLNIKMRGKEDPGQVRSGPKLCLVSTLGLLKERDSTAWKPWEPSGGVGVGQVSPVAERVGDKIVQ